MKNESSESSTIRAEMLKSFSEILDKHCTSHLDVLYFVRTLRDCLEYTTDKRYFYRTDMAEDIRFIRDVLTSALQDDKFLVKKTRISLFDDWTDHVQEIVAMSGALAEGLIVFNKMDADIDSYIEKFNC